MRMFAILVSLPSNLMNDDHEVKNENKIRLLDQKYHEFEKVDIVT